ncbi:acyl-CoA dehydrogenase family protein [Paracoccus sp. (in: a-proteobacteria)]|uniref:acyl-CoA dehydrogenase family protein n=1 Tax=Paracoccus sp. TaxID=267 RepID=UPI003A8902E2
MFDDLDPGEFEDTAAAVIATCAGAADTGERARLLAGAGVIGVLAPEAVGGLALPVRFAVPVATAAGAGLLAFPLIESLLLADALAGPAPEMARAICAGRALATIAWTGTTEAGVAGGAPLAGDAGHVLVFRQDGAAVLLANPDAETAPTLDLDTPEALIRPSPEAGGIVLDAACVSGLRETAQVLRAAFMLGAARECLTMAANYAQDREQFGKPLSANQVLRHRLSRDALTIETMRAGLARALAEPAEGSAFARQAVWLYAAEHGPLVAESAIQVFGGMGFTWEVPLHRHLRRMRAMAAQGGAAERLDMLGAELLRGTQNHWYEEIAHVG